LKESAMFAVYQRTFRPGIFRGYSGAARLFVQSGSAAIGIIIALQVAAL
jgi:hypothetical protein